MQIGIFRGSLLPLLVRAGHFCHPHCKCGLRLPRDQEHVLARGFIVVANEAGHPCCRSQEGDIFIRPEDVGAAGDHNGECNPGHKGNTGLNFPPGGCGAGNSCQARCPLFPSCKGRGSAGTVPTSYLFDCAGQPVGSIPRKAWG